MSAEVVLDDLSKRYPGSRDMAVQAVSLTVSPGEFMVLLGPSGCGKSTTLRMIAGLESISSGVLSIDGQSMNRVPARDRDIAMVFQSYALYPHMTVADNVAFGLKRRGLPRAEIHRRVSSVAGTLGLTPYLTRKPHALSGGQRQRVALGRAIVRDPRVFLFDEPLSNLDAALRAATRNELIKLHQRLQATMIYVTHDQVEAMTMGSRICIMDRGRVLQIGPPMEVYRAPVNAFVAGFLGSPPMNLIPATGLAVQPGLLQVGGQRLSLPGRTLPDGPLTLGIRPEDILLDHDSPATATLRARVEAVEPLGAETLLILSVAGVERDLTARVSGKSRVQRGEVLDFGLDLSAVHCFDAASGERLAPGLT